MSIRITNDSCTQKVLSLSFNDLLRGPYAGENTSKHVKVTALKALPKSVKLATF